MVGQRRGSDGLDHRCVRGLIDLLAEHTILGRPGAVIVVIAGLFALAWVVSRLSARVAAHFVDRAERRRPHEGEADTTTIASIRQRQTAISLIQTTVRATAFAVAFVLSIVALSGAQKLQTVLGASFLAIMIAFAMQRVLMDVVAGLMMFFEGWFQIGDTIAIDAWNVQGVIDAVSLRSLTIRGINGEVVHVPNSQVVAVRVIPHGYRDVELELFVRDLDEGRELVEEVARIVPVGPTQFVRRPVVTETETLDHDLYRMTVRCAVAVSREWLANDLLPALLKERAPAGLIVHGPIVTIVDEQAARSFAQAEAPV